MANKYTRKKGTVSQKPDEFVSFWQKVYDAVRPHARNIVIGIGAVVAVAVIVWAAGKWSSSSKEGATEALGRAIRVWENELVDEKAPKTDPKEGELPKYKTAKERAEATLAELDKLDKEHGGSDAAKRGLMLRAGVLFELGRYDEAEAAYRKFADGAEGGALRFVAREGVGLSLEMKGKLDEALKEYQELEKAFPGESWRDRVLYDQARVYTKKGDKKKAQEIYKDILAKSPLTPLKDDINARLAQLEG